MSSDNEYPSKKVPALGARTVPCHEATADRARAHIPHLQLARVTTKTAACAYARGHRRLFKAFSVKLAGQFFIGTQHVPVPPLCDELPKIEPQREFASFKVALK